METKLRKLILLSSLRAVEMAAGIILYFEVLFLVSAVSSGLTVSLDS